ncbi:MAG: CBS domain-containing protein [Deltaproteobacteria bacterium]|nr:CBS domain-containing protein [Deltaproteobacteria bacterium]
MSTELITLELEETLNLASKLMRLGRVRHLPVVDRHGRLAGLVTHRDLLNAQVSALAGLSDDETDEIEDGIAVSEIMISDVLTASPDDTALKAAEMLREHRYGCLPVVDGDKLVGIITEADFLELVIKALRGAGK